MNLRIMCYFHSFVRSFSRSLCHFFLERMKSFLIVFRKQVVLLELFTIVFGILIEGLMIQKKKCGEDIVLTVK